MLAPTSSGNLQRADSSGPPGSYYAPGAPLHHQVSGGGQAVGFNAAHGGHLQPMGSTGQAGAYHVHPNNLQPLGSGGQAVGFNKAPGGTMQHVDSSGQTAGFNPFGLSSPTAAAPADDAFATFSPLQPPPPPPVPQPMRSVLASSIYCSELTGVEEFKCQEPRDTSMGNSTIFVSHSSVTVLIWLESIIMSVLLVSAERRRSRQQELSRMLGSDSSTLTADPRTA